MTDFRVELKRKFARAAEQALQDAGVFAHQTIEIDDAQIHPLAASECEQLTGERGGFLAGLVDLLHLPERLWPVGQLTGQDLAVAVHDGDEVVEIVRHAAGEAADGIEMLGVHEFFLPPAFFRFIEIRPDDVRDPPAWIAEWIEVPRGVDGLAIGMHQVPLAGQRTGGGFSQPFPQAVQVGFFQMQRSMPLTDQILRCTGRSSHRNGRSQTASLSPLGRPADPR